MNTNSACQQAIGQLHLLKLPSLNIFEQLQIEEALLRADDRNWCVMNDGSAPSIVMGISGKPQLLLNGPLLEQRPVPVIRRLSGGGTVIVDENTYFVSFICNSAAVNTPCIPHHILKWTEEIYKPLFPQADFRLQENDYAIGDKKFGGNAHYLRKDRFLHHSSLLWDFDPARMEYLLIPPKMPAYRQQRSHHDFLCCMKEHHPKKEHFEKRLIEVLTERFQVVETTLEEAEEILDRPHRKATTYLSNSA